MATHQDDIPQVFAYIKKINNLKSEKMDDALKCCEEAIEKFPDSVQLLALGGDLCSLDNRLNQSIAYYSQAIDINPNLAILQFKLGCLFQKNNQPKEAILAFKEAIYINPNRPPFYQKLAGLLCENGNFEQAIFHYQKSIEIQADSPILHFQLGQAFAKIGDEDNAINCFKESAKLAPCDAIFHQALGDSLVRQQQFKAAIQSYEAAVKNYPQPSSILFFKLSCAYTEIGKWQNAISYAHKALNLESENVEFKQQLNISLTMQEKDQPFAIIDAKNRDLQCQALSLEPSSSCKNKISEDTFRSVGNDQYSKEKSTENTDLNIPGLEIHENNFSARAEQLRKHYPLTGNLGRSTQNRSVQTSRGLLSGNSIVGFDYTQAIKHKSTRIALTAVFLMLYGTIAIICYMAGFPGVTVSMAIIATMSFVIFWTLPTIFKKN